MSKDFYGWQRKTGVATLLIACMFMTAWFRSLFILDEFCVRTEEHSQFTLISVDQSIAWKTEYDESVGSSSRWPEWVAAPVSEIPNPLKEKSIEWTSWCY